MLALRVKTELASCLSRQDHQKNDDVCCICKSEGEEEEEELVMCDCCPCSFHKKCHLPHVEAAILE